MDKAARNRLICAGRPIPEGWVVIARCHSPACSGEGDNALVIKRPGRREVVGDDSPVPPGWARVRRARCEGYPGDGDNGWLIERTDSAAEYSLP